MQLQQQPTDGREIPAVPVFEQGARWMHAQLEQISDTKTTFDATVNYTAFGLFKYGICITNFLLAAFLLYRLHIYLLPLSILVFYVCEVQLLFLFPLLVDGIKNPVHESIRHTAGIGTMKAVSVALPIGIFMMAGLFNFKRPLRNWYTGCLAILIWYQHEVRNRNQ